MPPARLRVRLYPDDGAPHRASSPAVLYGIYALLDAHFRKEEEVYLPFLEYEQEAPAAAYIADAMTRHEHGEPQRASPSPQVALRLGYGPDVKATPRGPLSDVVLLETAGTAGGR